jgi:hypothetical protein
LKKRQKVGQIPILPHYFGFMALKYEQNVLSGMFRRFGCYLNHYARRYLQSATDLSQSFKLWAVRWVLVRRRHRQLFFRLAFFIAVRLCNFRAGSYRESAISPRYLQKKE